MPLILLLLFCFALVAIATVWLTGRSRQFEALRAHSLVAVKGAEARYPDLPLKQYGIASRLNATSGRVQVLFPKLTEQGDVEYLFSWHYLRDVTPIEPLPPINADTTLHTACEVLPMIRDHLEFEQDALHLNEQHRRLVRLADLVATSNFYGEQLPLYERAIAEIDTALLKARDLHKLYIRLVREALIGVQIAGYDPSNIRSDRLTFEMEHKRLREEYLYLRDMTAAYTKLSLENSSGKPTSDASDRGSDCDSDSNDPPHASSHPSS